MTIRFRVWDGQEMHHPPHDFQLRGDGSLYVPLSARLALGKKPTQGTCVVMQSTGLTDAEGTEIWEGDVIRKAGVQAVTKVVKWDVDGWVWGGKDLWLADDGKVIGNRYQNPDLHA